MQTAEISRDASPLLDRIDLRILSLLQSHGRFTNQDLAEKVGLTQSACLRRAQSLKARGFIKRFIGRLDGRKLGFGVEAFLLVTLRSQSAVEIAKYTALFGSADIVRDCSVVTGMADFVLHCVCRDQETLKRFVDGLSLGASVRQLDVKSEVKREPGIPLPFVR
jgi:Lrp/AsnC family leucine-responsive transcriptional regulator